MAGNDTANNSDIKFQASTDDHHCFDTRAGQYRLGSGRHADFDCAHRFLEEPHHPPSRGVHFGLSTPSARPRIESGSPSPVTHTGYRNGDAIRAKNDLRPCFHFQVIWVPDCAHTVGQRLEQLLDFGGAAGSGPVFGFRGSTSSSVSVRLQVSLFCNIVSTTLNAPVSEIIGERS